MAIARAAVGCCRGRPQADAALAALAIDARTTAAATAVITTRPGLSTGWLAGRHADAVFAGLALGARRLAGHWSSVARPAGPYPVLEAHGADRDDLTAVHVRFAHHKEVVAVLGVELTLNGRARHCHPVTDARLPLPSLRIEVLGEGVDAVLIGIRARVEAIAAPAVELTLEVRCLARAVGVHVDVDLHMGPTTDLSLATGPPSACRGAGLTVEAPFAVTRAAVGSVGRLVGDTRAIRTHLSLAALRVAHLGWYARAAGAKASPETHGAHRDNLSAVDVGLGDLEEVVTVLGIELARCRRARDDIPAADAGLPLPGLRREILRKGVDAVHVWVAPRVTALPAPAVKLALKARRRVSAVVAHVDVKLDLGPAAHLSLTTGPPLGGRRAGLTIEAPLAIKGTSVGCKLRGERALPLGTTHLPLGALATVAAAPVITAGVLRGTRRRTGGLTHTLGAAHLAFGALTTAAATSIIAAGVLLCAGRRTGGLTDALGAAHFALGALTTAAATPVITAGTLRRTRRRTGGLAHTLGAAHLALGALGATPLLGRRVCATLALSVVGGACVLIESGVGPLDTASVFFTYAGVALVLTTLVGVDLVLSPSVFDTGAGVALILGPDVSRPHAGICWGPLIVGC